jgi:hypothetical protein
MSNSVYGLCLLAALMVGCDKKAEAGAAGGKSEEKTEAPAATGIKGKISGKPFTGKVARVIQDSEGGNPTLYIAAFDASCKDIGFIPPKGENRASVTAPLTKGANKLGGDKIYAGLSMWNDKGDLSSNASDPQGEIEWLVVPTETKKGLARVKIVHESLDTKLEGSMEADLCPKK